MSGQKEKNGSIASTDGRVRNSVAHIVIVRSFNSIGHTLDLNSTEATRCASISIKAERERKNASVCVLQTCFGR